MLSNPTNNLHARQRQHRRQNSTPSAFDAVKIAPNLPNNVHQQQQHQRRPPHMSHRRGMSLDTRRLPARHDSMGFPAPVSNQTGVNTNNTGLSTNPQHVLREAQQQRMARPGNHPNHFHSLSTDDSYLISPHATPHSQRFDQSFLDPIPVAFDLYGQHMNGPTQSKDFDLFSPDSALSTPTFMSFQESSMVQGWISDGGDASAANSRRSSRRISNGIMDRVVKFENMGPTTDGTDQRPTTPPNQNGHSRSSTIVGAERPPAMSNAPSQGYIPPTPLETPHGRQVPQAQVQAPVQPQPQAHGQGQGVYENQPNRFSEGYDESMEETVKPTRKIRPAPRAQDLFAEMQQQQQPQPQANPQGAQMPQLAQPTSAPVATTAFGVAPMPAQAEFHGMGVPLKLEQANLDAHNAMNRSVDGSPILMKHSTSPQTPQVAHFPGPFDNKPDLFPPGHVMLPDGLPTSGSPSRKGSPIHRRTESLASIASAASIAGIVIEETKTETGVTMDDITAYIDGPDPMDNKWRCLFENCGKKFGRKENIKSHVQTHLNDRQYQCPTCKKCFVRQHDLKRHAKIHTGIKPYPCECGNSFARHDALTRHRQRGMCIGAFDGIVRKAVKRGRPRKHRPEMDERLEKSAKTRTRNKSTSSVSSQSGYSDSSVPSSPVPEPSLNLLDDVQLSSTIEVAGSVVSASSGGTIKGNRGMSYASVANVVAIGPGPAGFDGLPPVASPSAMSNASFHSVSTVPAHDISRMDTIDPATLPSQPGSPTKSTASQYNTPPELSQSSSPPPCTTGARLLDADPNTSSSTSGGEESVLPPVPSTTALDDQMMLQAWADGGDGSSLVNLDRDLMLGKFDEEYESAVNMFTEGGDMFFGSAQ